MGSPDGYGSHYGSPESASGIQKGRQEDIRRKAAKDHIADEVHDHDRAQRRGGSWWRRLLHRT